MDAKRLMIFTALALTITFIIVSLDELEFHDTVPLPKPMPRMRLEGLRGVIYESKWIQMFPSLKKMVAVVSDGDPTIITNAKRTLLRVVNTTDLRIGGKLSAIISTYDEVGRKKTYGGDFFAVVLRRPGFKTDGVTCEVTDRTNGNYSVSCILPWEGVAILDAKLMNPSETIYQLMKKYSSRTPIGITIWTTMLNSKNEKETTKCAIEFPDARPEDICDYSNPTHGERRTCLKPLSGECGKIIHQHKQTNKSAHALSNHSLYCQVGYNRIVPITGSGMRINISKATLTSKPSYSYYADNISKFSLDPMKPSGWILGGNWISLKKNMPGKLQLPTCISNKRLHFFGDSTARNMYRHFIDILKLNDSGLDNSVAWARGRDATAEYLNLTLQYRSHGPPLQNIGPEDSHPYMSDSFDAIRSGGKETIVMFTIGYHFLNYDADAYVRRVNIIKQAVRRFLFRLQGSKVIIKGLHYLLGGKFVQMHWLTYRFDVILRHEFRDIKDVYFMENWDFTLLSRNNNVHPQGDIFLGQIKILLSYIC